MAQQSFFWTRNGIKTVEDVTTRTTREPFTKKLSPGTLCNELSLDRINVRTASGCETIEAISLDPLYVMLCKAQREISNHDRKLQS